MKNILYKIVVPIASTLLLMSCGGTNKTEESKDSTAQFVNISIFVDLSDRLIRDNINPCQRDRDLEIVSVVTDFFKKETLGTQILKSQNKIRVLFFPTPKNDVINSLADSLIFDIGSYQGIEKRKNLEALKDRFNRNLSFIYNKTIQEKKWVGCDIWGFFSKGKVDDLCVQDNARNILIILTDGYLYHENTKIQEGNSYSYILPKLLNNTAFLPSLIAKRKGLKNLEVLVLEVNPYKTTHSDQIQTILSDWFKAMEVSKYKIVETDLTANVRPVIEKFLNE